MKRIYTLIAVVLLSTSMLAQAPQSFSYQAVVRGAKNELLVNKPVGMRLSLLQGSEKGKAVYVETHKPTSNENGLVSIAIGGGTKDASAADFTSIDWSKSPYFVQTETDVTGGSNYSLTSVSQLLSVPYALTSSNGISRVSVTGDSLILANGKSIIIPGLSAANPRSKPTSGYGLNITDVEGNSYKTVYIGTQQWMAENLKVTKYNDGSVIPNVTDNVQWSKLTTGAWSNYNNSDSLGKIYGKLYNWYAVSKIKNGNKNVCPTGWHIPTDAEWTVLTDYLGGEIFAGVKMKEIGTICWNSPNKNATNSSLFSGLPGGNRYSEGKCDSIGKASIWWVSSEVTTNGVWGRALYDFNEDVNSICYSERDGLSLRCLRD